MYDGYLGFIWLLSRLYGTYRESTVTFGYYLSHCEDLIAVISLVYPATAREMIISRCPDAFVIMSMK